MKVSACERGKRLILSLAGEIDHHCAAAFMTDIEEQIESAMPRDCVLDMEGVTFMDSSGIAVILKAYRRMRELDGRLWVENVRPQPLRVLDASGIDRLVAVTAQT